MTVGGRYVFQAPPACEAITVVTETLVERATRAPMDAQEPQDRREHRVRRFSASVRTSLLPWVKGVKIVSMIIQFRTLAI